MALFTMRDRSSVGWPDRPVGGLGLLAGDRWPQAVTISDVVRAWRQVASGVAIQLTCRHRGTGGERPPG